MEFTMLGRTGLRVGVVGLGCGGHSRLGQSSGRSEDESVGVVHRALELGVTFIDTAEAYGTEAIVGRAIAGRRDDVVLSTKAWLRRGDRNRSPGDLAAALDASLTRLGTDHVDVWHLHGLTADAYDRAIQEFLPVMQRARDAGKVRFLGVTEAFGRDAGHAMFERALTDDVFDVVMVGFNILNQSARERVFARTQKTGAGTLLMFAVRRALTTPERAREAVDGLRASFAGVRSLDDDNPLGFCIAASESLPDAAYRFCRHEPGVDVVLTGTGDVGHLEANVRSILRPPLPDGDSERLRAAFADVDTIAGN